MTTMVSPKFVTRVWIYRVILHVNNFHFHLVSEPAPLVSVFRLAPSNYRQHVTVLVALSISRQLSKVMVA